MANGETNTTPILQLDHHANQLDRSFRITRKQTKAPSPTDAAKTTCATLFGPDDSFVLTVSDHKLRVFLFTSFDENKDPCFHFNVEPEIASLYPAGNTALKLVYALDVEGKCWLIDFRPRRGSATSDGLAMKPLIVRVAQEVGHAIDNLVVLCLNVIIQTRIRGNLHELWILKPRTGLTSRLGILALDGPLCEVDPSRFCVLFGSCNGDARLVMIGEQCRSGMLEVHRCHLPHVTAITSIPGSWLVVALKGGLLKKADARDILPLGSEWNTGLLSEECRDVRTLQKTPEHGKLATDFSGEQSNAIKGITSPGQIDDTFCEQYHIAKTDFSVHNLYRKGKYLVALNKETTRIAVLDLRLNIKFEQKLDRAGVHLYVGQKHTQNLLLHVSRKSLFETWVLHSYGREIVRPRTDLISPVSKPTTSAEYWGQKAERCNLSSTLRVCVFPVIDSHQSFYDRDMSKLVDQVSAKLFSRVTNYFDECSFGQCAVTFMVFGHDFGQPRIPLVLQRSQQAHYFYGAYYGGGLKVVMPADFHSLPPMRFDGTETLQIQAIPATEAGPPKSYDVPFAAMWTIGNLGDFPVSLTFAGEVYDVFVERQEGDSTPIRISIPFPHATITVDQGGDINAFLDDLGLLVTKAIRDGEVLSGALSTLIEDVKFRRIRSSTEDSAFGLVQGQFRIVSAGEAAVRKGLISVSSFGDPTPTFIKIGLHHDAIYGVIDWEQDIILYFRHCLLAAQVDAGEGIGRLSAYFNTLVRTHFSPLEKHVTVNVDLAANRGGRSAVIQVVDSSGLEGTGWEAASPKIGFGDSYFRYNSNSLRDAIDLANHTFTAALNHIRRTTTWDRAAVEELFSTFDVMMIAHVGAPHRAIPTYDQWRCDDPLGFDHKRMYKRVYFARDLNPPSGEDPVQMGTSRIIGQRFCAFSDVTFENQAAFMARELGHAIDLPDLNFEHGYRQDVGYISPWGMMGENATRFNHFCGWSKWKLGWIPDCPDPSISRTIFADLPSATDTTVTESWLTPVEHWDDFMRDDVRDEVRDTLPIGQLIKLNLGSDGDVTAFLELRVEGTSFSRNLVSESAVIATNGLEPNSDRQWVLNNQYRRSLHLLNTGKELRSKGRDWHFEKASGLPISGCVASIEDIREVRGSIPVFRVKVERKKAQLIDLHFQDHARSWRSPDIWIDWPFNNTSGQVPRIYPVGTPMTSGDIVRYPTSGSEKHFVVTRVHNSGNVHAENVRLCWFVCDPPGAGDDGRWVSRDTKVTPKVEPGGNEIVAFDWYVDSTTSIHQCMRMEILDWKIPDGVDPATGDTVALASEDVKLQNCVAQQNLFEVEALWESHFEPITLSMQVHNDRSKTEVATLVPEGLPYGWKLVVDPAEQEIQPGKAQVFTCTLELDDTMSAPGCGNDKRFALTAWRRGINADENWGSCFYYIRPRVKTRTTLMKGSWLGGKLHIEGKVEMQPETLDYPAEYVDVYTRLWINSGMKTTFWIWTIARVGSIFVIDWKIQFGKELVAQAWADRSDTFGSSVSNELQLSHIEVRRLTE